VDSRQLRVFAQFFARFDGDQAGTRIALPASDMLLGPVAARTTKVPYRILVLEDDENALSGIVELLRDASYVVTGAETYDAAKRLLAIGSFDLFVSDVRLRGYNGINLVRQSAVDYPDMALVIISGYDEPMMEIEATRYGARFVRKPFNAEDFLNTCAESLTRVRRKRRWTRRRVIGGFRVTAQGRPAAVVDVSYGGLRLEVSGAEDMADAFEVKVEGIDLRFEVETVWSRPSTEGASVTCGAALATDSTPAARTWRAIVDRLSA
jgi:DNA-binding response OmpR family regulator